MNVVNHFVVYLAFRHGVYTRRIWLCYNHLHSFCKTFGLNLCLSYSIMAQKSSNYYRSKSLNAQWEDLSCSVSYLLNEHKEPTPKAESLGQIKTGHWVNSSERTHCADGSCRKKFTLTERKHHCRRYVKCWLAGLSSGYYKITRCYPNISNMESFLIKKPQLLVCKTCFDILMSSSVVNAFFNGCTFEFIWNHVTNYVILFTVRFEY